MKNRVPPQAQDVEKAVLGVAMLEKEGASTVVEYLKPEMFYNLNHQIIFKSVSDLVNQGQSIDSLAIINELKRTGELEKVGGGFYVTSLTNNVVSSARVLNECRLIVQCYLLRELSAIGAAIFNNSYENSADPFEIIEQTEKKIHELSLSINSKDFSRIDETLIEIIKDLEIKRHRDSRLTGITTGFAELDKATCGWQSTDLVILAARPKCGKTAFALNLALNAAMNGDGVGFFSMEMSASQLVKRILSNKASMYLQSLRDARLSDAQMSYLFENGVQKLAGIPFYIDDTAALTVAEFKAKARRMVKKNKVSLLVVDYLQLFQGDKNKKNQNREQEVGGNARQLKIAAKELNVPIICLSQLSREIEKRASNTPQLSDLRESGSIEQDADMVCFLYKPTEAEMMAEIDKQETIYFKIAAYRNGEPKTFEYDFKGEYQRFSEKGLSHIAGKNLIPIRREEDSFPNF